MSDTDVCSDCGINLALSVYQSNAGYYVGTWCNCGPYSRDSEYFKTEDAAQQQFLKMIATEIMKEFVTSH